MVEMWVIKNISLPYIYTHLNECVFTSMFLKKEGIWDKLADGALSINPAKAACYGKCLI